MLSDFLNYTVIGLETFLASCLSTYRHILRMYLKNLLKEKFRQKSFAFWHTPAGLHIRLLHVVLMFYSNDPHQLSQTAPFHHSPSFSSQSTAKLAKSLIEERAARRDILNRLLQNKCVTFALLDKINSTIYKTLLIQEFWI